jgi:hypothetical protein
MYRIKYWYNNEWCLTGTMPLESARLIANSSIYEKMEIVKEEGYWMP